VARYRQELSLKAVCAVIFDGLLGVVCPWFVIQATSINIQSLTLLINRPTELEENLPC
jgi:hypothetical protein